MKKTTTERAVIAKPKETPDFAEPADGVIASEIRYRRLFETAQDGMLILDADTRKIIDVNPYLINLLRYSRKEFIGKELWELGLLKDEEASKAAFTELQESGYIRYGDLRLETDLGRHCEVEFISNVYDEGDRQVIHCNIRDITDRKEAERVLAKLSDDLEEAAEDYRRVLDNSLDIICQLDGAGNFVKVSPAAKKVWGYEPEELIGTSYWQIVHPDDNLKTTHATNNTTAGKPTSTFENRTICKDGSVAYMMWSGNWSETHQILYCVARDVSELRLAETALEESSTNYRSLIESLPAIVCLSEPVQPYASKFVSPNAAAFGYSVEEWGGRPDMWISLIHEDDRERVLREVSEAMESGTETELEYRMVTHAGDTRWMRDMGLLIPDPEGIVNGWQRVITDVTKLMLAEAKSRREQREIEASLRDSEGRLRAIFENSPECIKLVSEKGELLDMNSAGLAMIEADSLDQVRGTNVYGLLAPEDRSAFVSLTERVFEGGSGTLEYDIVGLKGARRTLYTEVAPLRNDRGEVEAAIGITHDITEVKQAETELSKSRKHLEHAQKVAKMGSWETDLSTMSVTWSEETHRIFEMDVDSFQPTHEGFLQLIHPDDRAAVDKAFSDSVAQHSICSIKHRILMPDGRIKFIRAQWEILCDADDKPVTAVGTSQDITRRTLADASKLASEERFRLLCEQMNDGFYYSTRDGQLLDINPAMIEMFGYSSREEMLKVDVAQDLYFSSEERKSQILDDGKDESEVFRMRRKDGSAIWVEDRGQYKYDEDGNIAFHQGILRDVTERKLAEERLIQSEHRYRDLVENAHDIIYSHDLKGNYTSINAAGERITGYTHAEAMQISIIETVAPDQLERAKEMITRELKGEKVAAYELDIITKDGRRVTVEVNTKLVVQDGVPVGIQGIARDITERQQLEDQLRQSQKMEAVGQMAGGIAHDFNNMLTAINGYSDLTLRQMKADDPLRANIQEIKKAGDRSAALTNQLLAFSRQQILQPEVVYINRIITETSTLLERMIGEDVELIAVLNPKTGKVKVDPGQLSQIIMNLAVNARDAMPKGGKLTFETNNIFLDKEYTDHNVSVLPGAYVRLTVSDNGSGMDAETKQHIFEPFFTTKAAGEGTGLGLAMVYGIVKQSGGHIMVYSELGIGTTFKIYLPRVMDPLEQAEAGNMSDELPRGTETILVVEDEEIVRMLTRQILEMCGYTVLEAANGKDALAIFENDPECVNLLMTDVVMPEMGGRELAEKVSLICPEALVLFTSGYTDDAIVRHGVIAEKANFIQKPFTTEALARKVKDLFETDKKP